MDAKEVMRQSIVILKETCESYRDAGMSEEAIAVAASVMALVAVAQSLAVRAEVGPGMMLRIEQLSNMSAGAFAQYVKKHEKIDTSRLR